MHRRSFIEKLCGAAFATTLNVGGRSVLGEATGRSASEVNSLIIGADRDSTSPTGTLPRDVCSIAGEWSVRLDPSDVGLREAWFNKAKNSQDHIPLPGSTDEHHLGLENKKRESQHLTRTYQYTGPVWYQFDAVIPESWRGRRATLYLERCHWDTKAWLDDHSLGHKNSLSTPHIYELGVVSATKANLRQGTLSPGLHRLTVRVDNRMLVDIGQSSAVTAEVGATWNGIIGRMELQSTDQVWIGGLSVYPRLERNTVKVSVEIRNLTGTIHSGEIRLASSCLPYSPCITGGVDRTSDVPSEFTSPIVVSCDPSTTFEWELPVRAEALHWNELSPNLYDLSASLNSTSGNMKFSSEVQSRFGMRELCAVGTTLKLNGNAIVLRGTVDNGTFPEKGYVPVDLAFWKRRLEIYKDYGFNHVRFHSWCPPEAAFTAADELGILFQLENPMWIPDGRVSVDDTRTEFIRDEAQRIVDTFGNHPSFGLMSMGNEEGSGQDVFLGDLVRNLQKRDPRHLYTSTSAPDNVNRPDDYFVSAGPHWTNLRGDPRFENTPPNTNFDYEGYLSKAQIDRPLIAHELGQWTVFPNLEEGREYSGPLRPRYLETFRESLEHSKLLGHAEAFRRASGALTVALYKEEIEAILRTRGASGFQMLGLTDFPGFGPAFIGVLDTLGESKGLITARDFRRFCAPTVPLLRMAKRLWTSDETLLISLEVAHYGPKKLDNVSALWTLRDPAGNAVASGTLPPIDINTGGSTRLGEIKLPVRGIPAPACYSIELSVANSANDWNLWIYPDKLPSPSRGITVSHNWDDSTRKALAEGKTVLLLLDQQQAARTVPTSFTTIFWAASWFPHRHETMGILCDPTHPAFKQFPTNFHSDWQWWDLMSKSHAFNLTTAPEGFEPLVRVIDDAGSGRRLGAVIEARVGSGRLLATSFDLRSALTTRLAARQLLHSLLDYVASPLFEPGTALDVAYLSGLFGAEDR